MISFEEELRFEWDEGNIHKNPLKHSVSQDEIEQTFYNFTIILFDKKHLKKEVLFRLLGITNTERTLLIIFTMRNQKIRVISARDANKKERSSYENYQEA